MILFISECAGNAVGVAREVFLSSHFWLPSLAAGSKFWNFVEFPYFPVGFSSGDVDLFSVLKSWVLFINVPA